MRITPVTWDRLDALYDSGSFAQDFAIAYADGRAFAASPDALAARPPRVVEWTGGRRPPGDEVAPIDLRIDHVYMLSCKYLSANICNASRARLGNAPYFLLGSHSTVSTRLRVATVWDWRDSFQLRDLSIEGVRAGQPKVEWVARYRTRGDTLETRTLRGHVEIRWSHGRFAQPPEAKVYLDTPVEQVPGYHALGSGEADLPVRDPCNAHRSRPVGSSTRRDIPVDTTRTGHVPSPGRWEI